MLKPNRLVTGVTAFGITVMVGAIGAQVGRGTTEWLTAGGDAQRTFWIRTDPKISVESMSQPGFERQWSTKLDNRARGVNGLQHGVTANGVTLFVPMSIVAGSSNNIYAIDNDIGYIVWQRQFEAALPAATAQCPGGITAGATRIVPLVPPAITTPPAGRGAQSYRSVIGEPGQGVPLEGRGGRGQGGPPAAAAPPGAPPAGAPAGAAPPPVPPPGGANPQVPAGGAPGRQGGGGGGGRGNQGPGIPGAPEAGGGGLGRPSGVVYALSSDGMLHVLGLPSGKDIQKPAAFVPANAQWSDTIAVGTTLYATTTGTCGGAPNAVWAIDLSSADNKAVVSWKSNGGPIVGRLAFGSDGAVFAAIGPGTATADGKVNAIVALDPKTLQVKDWFTQSGVEFVTGPNVFKHNDRDVVAAATKDGRILLLNATSLGGSDHATALHASSALAPGISTSALATWQQLTITPPPAAAATAPPAGPPAAPPQPTITYGTRWILAATTNGITALKLTGSGSTPALERGWTAQGLTAPETPIVVNGVVFALATGRSSTPAGRGGAAMLRAYDGTSGKELWTSGKAMTASASPGSFWSAMSQLYVGTSDGTLHAFGFLDERR
jgi:putative pyrroloquinoline-quinone-binding quinoprotein